MAATDDPCAICARPIPHANETNVGDDETSFTALGDVVVHWKCKGQLGIEAYAARAEKGARL